MSRNAKVILIGAGGHAKVILSVLTQTDQIVECIYDDNSMLWGKILSGIEIRGPIAEFDETGEAKVIIGIGDNRIRRDTAEKFASAKWARAVHPFSFVHPSVKIGAGSVVFAGAVIQPDAVIGKHCIVNTGARIDHDCIIEDYAHIGPGCALSGGVTVGQGAFWGIGSCAIPGVRIGEWSIIGAGAAVVRNIPRSVVAAGVPARVIKDKAP